MWKGIKLTLAIMVTVVVVMTVALVFWQWIGLLQKHC